MDSLIFSGSVFGKGVKATTEIHGKLESVHEEHASAKAASFGLVLVQIVLLDIVFSLDSVITAVGMVATSPEAPWVGITVMVTAIVLAVVVMLTFAGRIAAFIERHPTMKILALSFLILIGVVLVAEGLHMHIPKGYVYFSMAFALVIEMLNLRLRKAPAQKS